MTRIEQIKAEAKKEKTTYAENGFIRGAEWADNNPNWISVEERLPENREWVLAFNPYDVPSIFLTRYEGAELFWKPVTHWMPLPPTPNIKAKCIKADPLQMLEVGKIYDCISWNGKVIVGDGSFAFDIKLFNELFIKL